MLRIPSSMLEVDAGRDAGEVSSLPRQKALPVGLSLP